MQGQCSVWDSQWVDRSNPAQTSQDDQVSPAAHQTPEL